ncbi:hypothetical protein ACE6H2_019518 [Prunus campanulata]
MEIKESGGGKCRPPSLAGNTFGFTNYVQSNHLSKLQFGNTGIKGEFLSFVANLTRLSTLILTGNNFQGEIPGSLFQLKNLEYLDLSSNNLSGFVEFDQFSKLKKLKGKREKVTEKISVLEAFGFNKNDFKRSQRHVWFGIWTKFNSQEESEAEEEEKME